MPDRQEFRYIGKNYTKVDGMAKVTGQTRYADDLEFPRMLFCKLLRADLPHARITGIDTSAADAMATTVMPAPVETSSVDSYRETASMMVADMSSVNSRPRATARQRHGRPFPEG